MITIRPRDLSGTLLLCLNAFAAIATSAGAQTSAPNEWIWQGGSKICCQAGVYGTEGSFSAENIPSGRLAPATANQKQGNLWLFGGTNSSGVLLNDLWELNPSTKQWAWVNGSNTGSAPGDWGVMGSPAATNIPSGRNSAAAWVDAKGNFWLFGGDGLDSNKNYGLLNDLWKYNPSTKLWTWMAGSNSMTCDLNTVYYKTICYQPANSSTPGGRDGAVNWTDSQGNLWLFGGNSYDSSGTPGYFNDFWQFSTSSNSWTFMGGASQITCVNYGGGNCIGSEPPQPQYGTLGVPASGDNPGGRTNAVGWTDSGGNLWIFGGENRISTDRLNYYEVFFNDVWKYDFSIDEWTWMAGANGSTGVAGEIDIFPAVYGVLGVSASGNNPGSRTNQNSWTDKAGNFWLFGGASPGAAFLDDIWMFNPISRKWSWMGGSTTPGSVDSEGYSGQPANYGALGLAAASNTPGGREFASGWTDSAGNFWLFGGGNGFLNIGFSDLWEYEPSVTSLPPAITPIFNPPAGSYTSTQSVVVSNGMSNASIYYSTDGSTPTSSSTKYTGPVSVAETETLKAIAIATGYPNSGVGSAVYTLHPPVATPTFSLPGGTYTGSVSVNLSDSTLGAVIYYTTDGTTPTTGSTVYSKAITVSSTETLKAIATAVGYSMSPVATAAYTIVLPGFSLAGTAVNVAPGATTGNTSTITLSPLNGFTGAIGLSCTITPAAASDPAVCSIPASVTINGSTAQTTTLTVNTAPATSALNRTVRFLWPPASGTALACILFAGFPGRRRRRWSALGMLAVLFCIVGGALGCGGGSSPNAGGGSLGTTPGTYVITITGTSGSITQTATVSLKVI